MICKGLTLSILFFLYLCFISITSLYSNIVINEVCYDPLGSDDYHEWIEFFNNGTTDVDMEDWELYSGGSEFTLTYTFPHFVLRPLHYLLLAEEDCSDAHLFANITLQNGGSESDGICLLSPDGLYTDTILYDSPNTNQLSDDISENGTELCPDVTEGHSLARLHDGVDSNSAIDWFDCSSPTPGSANIIPVNLCFGVPIIQIHEFDVKLHTPIHNLSTTNVYNSQENVEIRLDDNPYNTMIIPKIAPQDSVVIDITIHVPQQGAHKVSLFLNILHDVNPVDNLWITSIFLGEIPVIFNEILYFPSPDNQEWIEIQNRGNTDLSIHNLHLKDASHNEILFDLDIQAKAYKVLCVDSVDFVHNYPNCPVSAILKLNHWVTLNNDEETIWLSNDEGEILDSLHYVGTSQAYDRSLERRNPSSAHAVWEICLVPGGGTPGLINSNYTPSTKVTINFVQVIAQGDSLLHKIHLQCDESMNDIHLTGRQFDDSDDLGELVIDRYISLPADSVCLFTQQHPGDGYHAFQYQIETVAPSSGGSSTSEYWSYYNSNSLPFVVNEIMYDPLTGYPEWLEIRRNANLPNYPHVMIHITSDSVMWQPDKSQFTVIIDDEEDAETLCEQYQFTTGRFVYDLPSLLNSGEDLYFSDTFGNTWDAFTYDPGWSLDKGVSIERIQPALLPGSDNWSPCLAVCGGTPGAENSVYVHQVPTTSSISIHPNPFFPKKQDICEIRFAFPRAISRVSCKIYDLKGRLIRVLADQSLVSAVGTFLWDGKNDSAKALPIGVYIVYFEAYDKDQGNKFHRQNTIVLGD
jgi:hypothetical protein